MNKQELHDAISEIREDFNILFKDKANEWPMSVYIENISNRLEKLQDAAWEVESDD